MTKILETVHAILWGAPALVLILGIGLSLSLRTGWAQITLFPKAVKAFFGKMFHREAGEGKVSSFQALCTALAATVGTGNLVGVAGAICLGGPGVIFWMWVCGLIGMITKYAEVVLALRYRVKFQGEYVGGPMYILTQGLGKRWRWLACCYALFGVIAAFGVGNATQINSVIAGVNQLLPSFGQEPSLRRNLGIGLLMAVLVGAMLLGGARRIGNVAECLVPFAAAGYILLCLGVLISRREFLPAAFSQILQGAFSPRSVTGGVLCSGFQALQIGCARGVFTNEAGMGTASIAHAAADAQHPAQQGLMGIMEVFLDTLLICTLTALAILVSGVPIPYGIDAGGTLTLDAFSLVYGTNVSFFLTAALCCFAFATVLGWGLYGARCAQFLFGQKVWPIFALLQTVTVVLGAVLKTETVWLFAETVNGLMAIPNLISLAVLTPEVVRLTIEYTESDGKAVSGGNYANFHQRKPLRAFSHAEIPSSGCEGQAGRQKDLSSEYWSA